MIVAVKLVNTSLTSRNIHSVVVAVAVALAVRAFKIYSLSDFQAFSTVLLSTATMLRIPEPTHVCLGVRALRT